MTSIWKLLGKGVAAGDANMRDQEETVTVLTDAHQAVIRELEKHGVMLMEEAEFPPYRVDCYLPAYHVAIEIDGAQHSAKTDEERDAK
ncbi:hypothetical protein LCGC14_2768960, partial [marine sediment metagenome]